jgi:2',3'-cyclic-nucleotide 3'-phosphodiesterase
VADVLQKIMKTPVDPNLREGGSSQSYPNFYPHITLVGSIPSPIPTEVITQVLRQTESPLRIDFSKVEVGDHYYRSVYISMNPSEELWDLHGRMHLNLSLGPRTPAFPHLSLAYIDDEDASRGERRHYYEKLIRADSELVHIKNDTIEICVDGEWVNGFDCSEGWIADCDGPVEGWKIIEKISFNG